MFYIPTPSQAAAMDITKLVQKKLAAEVTVKQAIECVRIVEGKRLLRFAALVEKQEEHCVFIFTCCRIPCLQSSDLKLETVIAIDDGLRCQAEAPSKRDSQQADFRLQLKSSDWQVLLEMPRQDSTTVFLAEIKRAKDLQTQNSAFGETSSFYWLQSYKQECEQPSQSEELENKPLVEEIFDPLKHMNLQETNVHVQLTDSGPSRTTWFDDDLMTDPIAMNLHNSHQSGSRDSLDKVDGISEEFTESMESVQKQLGISTGAELPIGTKPVSSREKFVRQFLSIREDEFTDIKNFKVFCGSWNVNGQSPSQALHKWLVVDNEPPDIYALGFQELDLSKEAFIFTDSPKEAEWQAAVKSYLHPKAKYRKVKSVRLVGVLLIIYIQEKHVPHVSYIDADSVPTGIMGFMGNKGGVAVRFTLHSTALCFVNSHLAAHQEEFERRNQDYRDIITKTRFKQFEPPLEITEHDIVFWIGDLNYRIDLPMEEVKKCIRQGSYTRLLEGDQLFKQMRANSDVFKGFEEGVPNFNPTYKFDSGSDNYDSSEKNRVPAWCDRILWRGPGVEQLRYISHPYLKISDHKPVSSLFTIGVRVIDQKRYKKVYEDIMKKLDRLENDYLPQIKLDKTECVFKDVKFIESQTQIVTVANIGQVPVEFEFINKLDDQTYCQPWLKATPNKSIILPGSCCEVHVEIYVDKNAAAKLNAGQEQLEDILVLHLTGGKDSFEQPGSLSRVDIAQDGGRLYMVPKEIWKLVDFLHKKGLDKKDLFQQPGRNSEIQLIRDCLDTSKPEHLHNVSVHSVAESLLLFLECLAQPVIPHEFYTRCLASSNNLLLSKQVISSLPDCHKNVFMYICAFLRELLQHAANNSLDIKILSTIFGEVMLQPPLMAMKQHEANAKEHRSRYRDEEAKKAAFVHLFISSEIDL